MKKITLLLSLTFLIFSCSDDEGSDIVDEPVISQPIVDEPIATGTLTSNLIGTWSRISSTADGVDNQSSDWARESILVFSEGTILDTHYDEINGDCVLDFVDAGSYIATNDVLEFIFEDGEELVVDYTVIDSILTITVTMEGIEFIDVYMSVEDLDINDSSSADLVGTWIYTQSFKNGVDEELDDCVLMDTITFTSTDITSDVHNVIDGVCVEDGSSTQDYIATNSTITVIEFDQVDGEEVEDSTTVNYSINGSILTFLIESEFRVEDENGDLIEDEEGEYVTEITSFREVYTRVN